MVFSYNGILFSNKNEHSTDMSDNIDNCDRNHNSRLLWCKSEQWFSSVDWDWLEGGTRELSKVMN